MRSKLPPLLTLAASFCAACTSTPAVTCSTSATMSPMPRMRPAWRSASNTSSPSIFSLTPANLIGAPVIWRTDSAAPPRESPSSLVRMMPVSGNASLKALAVLTASWPCIASTTNRVSTGFSAACRSLISRISDFVDRQPAGGVDQQHVEIVPLGVVERGPGDVHRLLVAVSWETIRRPACLGHRLELLDGGRAVDVARDGQHLLLALLDQVLGQLGRRRGLARALQAGHQDHGRRLRLRG